MSRKVCILGATGCVGFELATHLLQAGCEVLAVVRDASKLRKMLGRRDRKGLTIIELDLFTERGSRISPVSSQR